MSDAHIASSSGWFPDPGGSPQERFWDGAAWTGYLRDPQTGTGERPPLPPLASFGQRAGAALIDGFILSAPLIGVFGMVFILVLVPLVRASTQGRDPTDAEFAILFVLLPLIFVIQFGVLLLNFAYYIGFERGEGGQTIGKWVMGIRVIDVETGGDLSRRSAGLRTLVKVFASGQVILGYLWMLWDKEKRTWHDMAATTHVIRDPRPKRSFSEVRHSFSLKKDPA